MAQPPGKPRWHIQTNSSGPRYGIWLVGNNHPLLTMKLKGHSQPGVDYMSLTPFSVGRISAQSGRSHVAPSRHHKHGDFSLPTVAFLGRSVLYLSCRVSPRWLRLFKLDAVLSAPSSNSKVSALALALALALSWSTKTRLEPHFGSRCYRRCGL